MTTTAQTGVTGLAVVGRNPARNFARNVAECMGHSNINVTFKIYRHLMPASVGRAARLLNEGL